MARATKTVLARTTARLNGIIASAMDAIISVDSRQRILVFNKAAEAMFGVGAREALGENLGRFIPERFRSAHTKHVVKFGQTGVSNRLKQLKEEDGQISLAQIYSATRPMARSGCSHLRLRTLSQIARTVRQVAGVRAEVF